MNVGSGTFLYYLCLVLSVEGNESIIHSSDHWMAHGVSSSPLFLLCAIMMVVLSFAIYYCMAVAHPIPEQGVAYKSLGRSCGWLSLQHPLCTVSLVSISSTYLLSLN